MYTRKKSSEDRRYLLYRIGAHGAWWGAFAWTAILTVSKLQREITEPPTRFEQVSGLFIILLMGVAIALGSALARMRLAKTISRVFEAGMMVGHFHENDNDTKVSK